MHAVCPVQLTFLDLFILIIRRGVCRPYESPHYAGFQIYYHPLSIWFKYYYIVILLLLLNYIIKYYFSTEPLLH